MEFSTLDLDWSFKLSSVYLVAEYLSVKMYSLKGLYGLMVLWLKKTESNLSVFHATAGTHTTSGTTEP